MGKGGNMSDSKTGQNGINEMFGQAARFFQTALEAGIKIQEQSAQALTEMIGGLGSPQQWRERAEAAMEKTVAVGQQNMEEALRIMDDNTKNSLELLEKAFKARQPESAEDLAAKSREMWETAVGSLRRNTEVMIQASGRMVKSWSEIAQIFRSDLAGGSTNGQSPQGQ